MASVSGSAGGRASDKARLEAAREHIEKVVTRDAKLKDRELYDRLLRHARTDAGLYDECADSSPHIHKRPQFCELPGGFTSMPAALRQAAAELEFDMFMGLFPEVHRAWLSIDHVLFLWDYTDPRGGFYQYDGLDQTIIHAALVPCRDGVFATHAKPRYLLLLSTPIEVVILAVYATGPPGSELSSLDVHETGFSVPSDGVNLIKCVGSPKGRVFMSGADGFLYELIYSSSSRWWHTYKSCVKTNRSRKRERAYHFLMSAIYECSDPILDLAIDSHRHILYTLSAASTIQVYDLGPDGEGLSHVFTLDVKELLLRLRRESDRSSKALATLEEDIRDAHAKAGPRPNDKELKSALTGIFVVPKQASAMIQLMALSSSGVRIGIRSVSATEAEGRRPPDQLRPLLAVSPPLTPDKRLPRVARGGVLCAADVMLLAASNQEQQGGAELVCVNDVIVVRPDDASRRSDDHADHAFVTRLKLSGSVFAIAEEPHPSQGGYELATQHSLPSRSFVVLTSEGVTRLKKQRPLDLLLAASASPALPPQLKQQLELKAPLADFFAFYTADEACAMCLVGAIQPHVTAAQAEALAALAAELGEPSHEPLSAVQQLPGTQHGAVIRGPSRKFSGRYGGITRVLARILAPAWAEPLLLPHANGMRLRRPRGFWLSMHSQLHKALDHLLAHAGQWGVGPAAADVAGRGVGGSRRVGELAGGMLFTDRGTAEVRWRGMELKHDSEREGEALKGVLALLSRASQVALLLATLASDGAEQPPPTFASAPTAAATTTAATATDSAATTAATAAAVAAAAAEPPVLMQRVYVKLPPKLQGAVRDLRLQRLLVPVRIDGHGKAVAGEWDDELAYRLPKALFIALGELQHASAGGSLTEQLQRECPDLFSATDASSLHAWELIHAARQVGLADSERAQLLNEALLTFQQVAKHIELADVLHAFFTHRGQPSGPRSETRRTAESAMLKLTLEAAKAHDPDAKAAHALLKGAPLAELPVSVRASLCARLRCYRLLFDKLALMMAQPLPQGLAPDAPALTPTRAPATSTSAFASASASASAATSATAASAAPASAASAAAAAGVSEEAWSLMLVEGLSYEPADELFHHAAFWLLLAGGRRRELLALKSPLLEAFLRAGAPPPQARAVWSRFLHPGAAAALESWDGLTAALEADTFGAAMHALTHSDLLPSLLVKRKEYIKAATAFSLHAVRSVPADEAERQGERLLESRISALGRAADAAKEAGDKAAAELGTDFIRMAKESEQRARVQLRIARELRLLTKEAPGRLEALARAKRLTPDALKQQLTLAYSKTCEKLLELDELFALSWEAHLWPCALAVLGFAQPFKEYPDKVCVALSALLRPLGWEELKATVRALRAEHPDDSTLYIFRLDLVCATLELARRRASPQADPAAVALLLSPRRQQLQPPLPWAALYQCYSGPQGCGREMKKLWDEPHVKPELLRALCAVVEEWILAAKASPDEMLRLLEMQRQLGIVAELDAHILNLDGGFAVSSAMEPLARLRTDLRHLRDELTAISRR